MAIHTKKQPTTSQFLTKKYILMKKHIIMLAMSSMFAFNNANAISVFDARAAAHAVQQINEARQQVAQLKAQVDQAKVLYKSLNGTRGIVNLLENPLIIGKLPKDYQELYAGIKGAKNDKWEALYKLSENGRAISEATPENIRQAYDNNVHKYNEQIINAFDATTNRINKLNDLTQKIAATKDPKEIADLQARIAAEQGIISLDTTRLNLLKEMRTLEKETLRDNASKSWQESLRKPFVMPKI